MMMYVQMGAIIRGEHRCDVASLWRRHAPSCGLAISTRHQGLNNKTFAQYTAPGIKIFKVCLNQGMHPDWDAQGTFEIFGL